MTWISIYCMVKMFMSVLLQTVTIPLPLGIGGLFPGYLNRRSGSDQVRKWSTWFHEYSSWKGKIGGRSLSLVSGKLGASLVAIYVPNGCSLGRHVATDHWVLISLFMERSNQGMMKSESGVWNLGASFVTISSRRRDQGLGPCGRR